jgi:iron complex outermembrane recepter protein
MHNQQHKKNLLALAVVATMGVASHASAQLEEVVVTAQKRSESMQEVAVSITAVDGDTLSAMNVRNTAQLAEITPNLTIQTDRPGQSFPAIRGIGTPIKGPGVDQGVAMYLDGVQVDSSGANLLSVVDLAQVEVLKGPQGTLYGRNAVGGVINMVSRQPAEEFEGSVKAGFGNYGSWETGVSVEGPIVENTLTGRISGVYQENDAYFKNREPGVDDNGATDNSTIRGMLVYTPTDNLDITFSADYNETDTSGPNWRTIGISNHQANAAALGGLIVPVWREPDNDKYKLSHNLDTYNNSEIYGGSIKIDWALSDTLDFISITGYRETEQELLEDLDASPNQYLEVASQTEFNNTTQEFRLHYTGDSLKGVTGFFYNESENDNLFSVDSFAEFIPVAGGGSPSTTARGGETEAWALFTQWDWDLTDALTLILGARYGESEKETYRYETSFTEIYAINQANGVDRCFILESGRTPEQQPDCLTQLVPGQQTNAEGDGDWSNFSPKVGLRYIFENGNMMYASYSEGYRDGGLAGSAAEFTEFDEEIVDAYEVGFKTEMAEGMVRFNGSVFYYDYTDMQLQLSDLSGNQVVTKIFNAGEAEMFGGELELSWLANDFFTLHANMGYLDTEITDLEEDPNIDYGFISEGNEFPQSPQFSASLVPEFYFDLFGGSVLWRTEINYTDEYFEDAANGGFATAGDAAALTGSNIVEAGGFDPSLIVSEGDLVDHETYDSKTLVNMSFIWTNESENLDVTLWARNLTDEEWEISRRYVSGVVFTNNMYAPPRTYGIKAEYRF